MTWWSRVCATARRTIVTSNKYYSQTKVNGQVCTNTQKWCRCTIGKTIITLLVSRGPWSWKMSCRIHLNPDFNALNCFSQSFFRSRVCYLHLRYQDLVDHSNSPRSTSLRTTVPHVRGSSTSVKKDLEWSKRFPRQSCTKKVNETPLSVHATNLEPYTRWDLSQSSLKKNVRLWLTHTRIRTRQASLFRSTRADTQKIKLKWQLTLIKRSWFNLRQTLVKRSKTNLKLWMQSKQTIITHQLNRKTHCD